MMFVDHISLEFSFSLFCHLSLPLSANWCVCTFMLRLHHKVVTITQAVCYAFFIHRSLSLFAHFCIDLLLIFHFIFIHFMVRWIAPEFTTHFFTQLILIIFSSQNVNHNFSSTTTIKTTTNRYANIIKSSLHR